MPRKTPILDAELTKILANLGTGLHQARKQKGMKSVAVAERSGITRATLVRVEKGDPAVSLGIYAKVMQALGLEQDLAGLGQRESAGRKDPGLEPIREQAKKVTPKPKPPWAMWET